LVLVQLCVSVGRVDPEHSASATRVPSLRSHQTLRVCVPTEQAPALQAPKALVRQAYVGVVQVPFAAQVPL
jgi:hypothetical protein